MNVLTAGPNQSTGVTLAQTYRSAHTTCPACPYLMVLLFLLTNTQMSFRAGTQNDCSRLLLLLADS